VLFRMSIRRASLPAVVAVVALLAAACGSSSSGSSSGSGGSTSAPAATSSAPAATSSSGAATSSAASGGTIKVGTMIPLTGTGLNYPDWLSGAKASVAAINAAGGVNGSKIDLIECDDQNNPNQALACARKLVGDHVAIIAGGLSLFGTQVAQVLKPSKMSWFGALPITIPEGQLPNLYPFEAGYLGDYGPTATFAKNDGAKSLAGFVLQGATGAGAAQALQEGAKKAGIAYKGTITVPIDASDYAPYVQKLVGLHADAIGTQLAAAQFLLLLQASSQAGAKFHMYQPAVGIAPNIFQTLGKSNPILSQVTAVASVPPPDPSTESDYPGIKQYLTDIKSYEASSHDPHAAGQYQGTAGSIISWAVMQYVAQIAKTVPSGTPVTQASFQAALDKAGPLSTGLGPAWNPPLPAGPLSGAPRATNLYEWGWGLKDGAYTLSQKPISAQQALG
jgi:ABC-type branched-subunit amino acid transport system substrate-binding protein